MAVYVCKHNSYGQNTLIEKSINVMIKRSCVRLS